MGILGDTMGILGDTMGILLDPWQYLWRVRGCEEGKNGFPLFGSCGYFYPRQALFVIVPPAKA